MPISVQNDISVNVDLAKKYFDVFKSMFDAIEKDDPLYDLKRDLLLVKGLMIADDLAAAHHAREKKSTFFLKRLTDKACALYAKEASLLKHIALYMRDHDPKYNGKPILEDYGDLLKRERYNAIYMKAKTSSFHVELDQLLERAFTMKETGDMIQEYNDRIAKINAEL